MIALLLGSFNPVHNGHLAIASYMLDRGLSEEVWFVVSPQNPLKDPMVLAPYEARVEMTKIATLHDSRMVVCEIEASLPSPSYTINTIRELKIVHPEYDFTILAGSDIKEQLPMWYEYQQIQNLVDFTIYPRGEDRGNCSPQMRDAPLINVDSTECRAGLYPLKESVKEVLPEGVLDYIIRRNLYVSADVQRYEHGMQYYKTGDFGNALNCFIDALDLNPHNKKAAQMKLMSEQILSYRYMDIYNP